MLVTVKLVILNYLGRTTDQQTGPCRCGQVYLVWSARKGFSAAKHALAYWRRLGSGVKRGVAMSHFMVIWYRDIYYYYCSYYYCYYYYFFLLLSLSCIDYILKFVVCSWWLLKLAYSNHQKDRRVIAISVEYDSKIANRISTGKYILTELSQYMSDKHKPIRFAIPCRTTVYELQ